MNCLLRKKKAKQNFNKEILTFIHVNSTSFILRSYPSTFTLLHVEDDTLRYILLFSPKLTLALSSGSAWVTVVLKLVRTVSGLSNLGGACWFSFPGAVILPMQTWYKRSRIVHHNFYKVFKTKWIKSTILLKTAEKYLKYFGIHLTKDVEYLYDENYETKIK